MDDATTPAPRPADTRTDDQLPKAPARALPEDAKIVTRHVLHADGTDIAYEAALTTTRIGTAKVDPAASVFAASFVALPDGEHADPARPITFVFNGGPGSATTFLLMGSIAPRRIATPDAAPVPAAPYRIIDNPQTLLPVTDLVFVDAPGAGFSQIAEEAKAELWSTDGDVAGFVRFIRHYLSANSRWNSPKYVLGESYGTTRGAALSLALLNDDVALNGLILLSCILDYGPLLGAADDGYVGFFPTYAAIAHRHGKAGRDATLTDHVAHARRFADQRLRPALAAGANLPSDDLEDVVAEFSALTGLDPLYVRRSHLRVTDERFRKELLRDEQRVVGRYDGRVSGFDLDDASDKETFVVDDSFVSPGYGALVNVYLRDELGWKGTVERRSFADFDWDSSEPGKGWVWKHKLPAGTKTLWGLENPYPYVVPDLAAAIVRHPTLKVLACNGYFDLATPFFQTEHDFARLGVPRPLLRNIAFAYYEAGHMVYTSEPQLAKFSADLTRFYGTDVSEMASLDERS